LGAKLAKEPAPGARPAGPHGGGGVGDVDGGEVAGGAVDVGTELEVGRVSGIVAKGARGVSDITRGVLGECVGVVVVGDGADEGAVDGAGTDVETEIGWELPNAALSVSALSRSATRSVARRSDTSISASSCSSTSFGVGVVGVGVGVSVPLCAVANESSEVAESVEATDARRVAGSENADGGIVGGGRAGAAPECPPRGVVSE
jgi:hypothetical protein